MIWLNLTLIAQYLHYKDYKNNKRPKYLKPFQMIEGLISPQSIGLINKVEIIQFIKLTKKLLFISNLYSTKLFPIVGIICSIFPMIINCSLIILIVYILPISAVIVLSICNAINVIIYQSVYLYLICYYLNIKFE